MYEDERQEEKQQEPKQEPRTVNTYDPRDLHQKPPRRSGTSGWKRGLIIFLIIVAVVVVAGVGCNAGVQKLVGGIWEQNTAADYAYTSDYIGVLPVYGDITSTYDPQSSYNQGWMLDRIDQMMEDPLNQGMILDIDTPGGEVYAVDEVYMKLQEYKKTTGRPIYVYMESMAASGGYYLSMASEKIYANRNCWTGSIGVTLGTMYDISEFLDRMGIQTVTITSGDNKAMGSSTEPMTEEQLAIFQSLVDEAYDQFVEVVAEGRGMTRQEARKLGDGRIYTAKQAIENGLIDEIGSLEDAVVDLQHTYELEDCVVQTLTYEPEESLFSLLSDYVSAKSDAASEYEALQKIMEENGIFSLSYRAPVRR